MSRHRRASNRLKLRIGALLCIAGGVFLMLCPIVGNFFSQRQQQSRIRSYEEQIDSTTEEEREQMLEEARKYNEMLGNILVGNDVSDSYIIELNENYDNLLNLNGDGIMGYVSIPQIDVMLPIFHEESTKGASHLRNTSLPVGGNSTHAVLAAHSGLSSSRQFTDLESLEEGDVFYIYVMKKKLSYRVNQICVVEPGDTSELMIENGKDYVTLLTCTPYGVNSHRLLVRGERLADEEANTLAADYGKTNESSWYSHYCRQLVWGTVLGLLFFVGLYWFMTGKKPWLVRVRKAVCQFPETIAEACVEAFEKRKYNRRRAKKRRRRN